MLQHGLAIYLKEELTTVFSYYVLHTLYYAFLPKLSNLQAPRAAPVKSISAVWIYM